MTTLETTETEAHSMIESTTRTSGYALPDAWRDGGNLEQDAVLGTLLRAAHARFPVRVTVVGGLVSRTRMRCRAYRCTIDFFDRDGGVRESQLGWYTPKPRHRAHYGGVLRK